MLIFKEKILNGFTLAEILITLGIIGIVAAMTMPALIANVNKRKTATKLAKAYAEINHAYKMSIDELSEPSTEEARQMKAEAYLLKYWAPYIKIAHYCKNYKDCYYQEHHPWRSLNGSTYSTALGDNPAFYTTTGALYMIRVSQGDGSVASSLVLIDINGATPPNQLGKDTFIFYRKSDKALIEPDCSGSNDNTVNNNCSLTSSGSCCAEKIRRAGWKIDLTYPW